LREKINDRRGKELARLASKIEAGKYPGREIG